MLREMQRLQYRLTTMAFPDAKPALMKFCYSTCIKYSLH